jgi:AcrR family transcriptional regulator
MQQSIPNKHASRSARTREKLLLAAQKLYGERSIDAVSLNEITKAAGQRNRTALRYHFGDREGLLQAIIDRHSEPVSTLRKKYREQIDTDILGAARSAARLLIIPLGQYIDDSPEGAHYISILSQLAALNSEIVNPAADSRLEIHGEPVLDPLMREAMAHLKPAEIQRRLFVVLSITFHGIADVCRAVRGDQAGRVLRNRDAMLAQVALSIERLLEAPSIE